MESLSKKLGELRVQDFVTFLICALSVYLLRVRETFYITPAWWKDLDEAHYLEEDGNILSTMQLPRPIVTDIDGDGSMEVIIITMDLKLEILSPMTAKTNQQLPRLSPVESVSLENTQVENGSLNPVALETGYLSNVDKNHQYRKQVVVVVMDDWSVLCYDYRLRLLWSQKLMDVGQLKETYIIKSMAVLISSHSLQKHDQGMVIVGGSFAHKSHSDSKNIVASLDSVNDEQLGKVHTEPSDNVEDDPLAHFSTFALSGTNGTIRWHHLPGDFEMKETKPHKWEDVRDTSFDLSHLRKLDHNIDGSNAEPTVLADFIDFDNEHLMGLAYGGLPPHSRHEHVHHPNALIAHNHNGLEVLNLETGRPLTRIKLSQHKTVFVDINEDGTLEQVQTNFKDDACQAEVSTIHPRPKALYKGPVCEPPKFWGAVSFSSFFQRVTQVNEDTQIAVPPVVVKSVSRRAGIINHLMGNSLASSRRGHDSVHLTSTGLLTSYSPHGEFNWQTLLSAQWAEAIINIPHLPKESRKVYRDLFKPSMVPLSAQVYGRQNLLLVSGWDTLSLVDLRDGYILAEHSLPCQPTDTPVVEDFSEDGWSDFIISCPTGYLGFTVTKQPSYVYMTLMSVTVVLTILLLSWCCKPDPIEDLTDY